MHPVRQTILNILKRDGHATVRELARDLEMAPVSVRHHLDLLISDNLVTSPRVRRGNGAGRPQQVYALTPAASEYFPNSYKQLAQDSLYALKEALSPDQLKDIMESWAGRIASQAPSDLGQRSLPERVQAIASFLSDQGYMAECDQGPDAIYLHTCNCPYTALVKSHQELCHMDHCLVNLLTGVEPERISHIARGDGRCSYRIDLLPEPQIQPLSVDSAVIISHG